MSRVFCAEELSKQPVHAYEWRVVVKSAQGVRVGSVPLVPRQADPGVSSLISSAWAASAGGLIRFDEAGAPLQCR